MEKQYKLYLKNNDLGTRVNSFPITNGQIDFKKTHVVCRDLPCCITFLIFCILAFVVFVVSVSIGKPGLMYNPVDSWDGICGYDFQSVNNKGRPYLMEGSGGDLSTVSVCVSECPSKENNCACLNQNAPFHTVDQEACNINPDCSFYSGLDDTVPLMDYCVPASDKRLIDQEDSQILRDIVSRIWVCGVALGITVGLCVVYIILLIFFAYYIVWGSVVVSIVGMYLLTAVFFVLAGVMFARGDEESKNGAVIFLVFGIIFLIVSLIITCVTYCFRDRINLSIAVVQEACRGIRATPTLCVVPVFFTALSAGTYVLYSLAMIFFLGTFPVTVKNGSRSIEVNGFHDVVIVLNFFVMMWISLACIGLAQSVIAGGLAAWYFSDDREHLHNTTPVASAFYRTFRYSLGTICAGSGIIALIETLKYLSRMAEESMRSSAGRGGRGGGGNSGAAELCICLCCCCLRCMLSCVENYLSFISERAYILASITGEGFIQSCKSAFRLLLRNIITTLVLENVKSLPITLGKIFIFLISAFLTLLICNPYIFSSSTTKTGGYVVEYWYIVFILSIFVIFFVLEMMTVIVTYSIDSIFVFYLVDQEYARSTGSAPFASPDLSDHMGGIVSQKGRELASKYDISIPADPPPSGGGPGYGGGAPSVSASPYTASSALGSSHPVSTYGTNPNQPMQQPYPYQQGQPGVAAQPYPYQPGQAPPYPYQQQQGQPGLTPQGSYHSLDSLSGAGGRSHQYQALGSGPGEMAHYPPPANQPPFNSSQNSLPVPPYAIPSYAQPSYASPSLNAGVPSTQPSYTSPNPYTAPPPAGMPAPYPYSAPPNNNSYPPGPAPQQQQQPQQQQPLSGSYPEFPPDDQS